jgi:rhodanese-related sulfurtransferase
MSMRSGTWVCLSLGLLAAAACSGGGGGRSGAAEVGGEDSGKGARDVGVTPDRTAADERDIGSGPADAGPDTGAVVPDSADSHPSSGADTGVAPDVGDASRSDGREVGGPADVAPGRDGRDLATSVEVAPVGDTVAPRAWPTGKYISVDEVYARVQAKDPEMLLVNVVDEQYYSYGFVPGSLKIPYDTLAGRLGELDRTRHIVVYCRKGVRSETAYTTLLSNGYTLVWVMQGGIEQWSAAGYPVVAE